MKKAIKQEKRIRRHKRVRAKVAGTAKTPRLCVFRSGAHIYAQLINDENGQTIGQASDLTRNSTLRLRSGQEYRNIEISKLQKNKKDKKDKTEKTDKNDLTGKVAVAKEIGLRIAQAAKEKGISQIVFDRGGFRYQGRVKALADGARQGGLKF